MDAFHDRLPKLPVPELQQTITKLLHSLKPFAQDYDQLSQLAQDFIQRDGSILQERLREHARKVNAEPFDRMVGKGGGNWLDAWWLNLAYLSWREPLMVNSNWFLVMRAHPEHPAELKHPTLPSAPSYTRFQVYRAAGFIQNALNMKEAVDNNTIEAEVQGRKKIPLCMNQYRLMFGVTRVPHPQCDVDVAPGEFRTVQQGAPGHVTVIVNDLIYELQCYSKDKKRLSLKSLESALWLIVQDSQKYKRVTPIGILTADHRDAYEKAHAHLIKLGNQQALQSIESSVLCLCLDDQSVPFNDFTALYQNTAHGTPSEDKGYGRNRWFDKALSLIVMADGSAGINGEHSPCDALIPSRFIDWLVENEPAKDPSLVSDQQAKWKLLKWKTDAKLKNEFIPNAIDTADKIGFNSDAQVLIFQDFGGKMLRSTIGTVSPDVFIQMALQTVFYKLSKEFKGQAEFCGVYETASTRQFLKGRTECIRSCSVDSVAFVKALVSADVTSKQKYELLIKASQAHVKYTIEAMNGQGVDRHILGLKVSYSLPAIDGKELKDKHALFSHPAMLESTRFRLSTSQLSSGENYNGTGFGTVEPDGYGINYCIGPTSIKFGIESKRSCKDTSTTRFKEVLGVTLREMLQVCREAKAESTAQKL